MDFEKEWGQVIYRQAAGMSLAGIKQQCLHLDIDLCTKFRDEVVKYLLRYAPSKITYGVMASVRWDAGKETLHVDLPAPDPQGEKHFQIALYPDNFYTLTAPSKVRTSGYVSIKNMASGKDQQFWVGHNVDSTKVGQEILAGLQKRIGEDRDE
jgi:hypothetical protein